VYEGISMKRRQLITQGTLALGMLSKLSLVQSQSKPLQIGVLPNVSARIIAAQYESMQSHLSQKLERTVTISTAPDWGSFYRNVKADQYDLIVSAVHVARLMQIDLGMRPIASYQPNIKGLFVTSKVNPEQSAKAVKGLQVAIANPASLIAFESERWFERQGLKLDNDYKVLKVRGDDSVGLTITRGEAAGGIMSMGEFNAHPPPLRDQLKIVQIFAEVPSFVVLTSPRVSPENCLLFAKQLAEFSESSVDGKLFEDRTGFKIKSTVNDKDLLAMDAFVEKTRKLMT
jgi:phosphonate transport system substrate-binding protein